MNKFFCSLPSRIALVAMLWLTLSGLGAGSLSAQNMYNIHVPGWFSPGDPAIDTLSHTPVGGVNLEIVSTYQWLDLDCTPGEIEETLRTYQITEWNGTTVGPVLVLPALDLDGDGQVGDPYDILLSDSVYLLENGVPTLTLGPRTDLYEYQQRIVFSDQTTPQVVTGTVFADANDDCTRNASNEFGLGGWLVKAVGQTTGHETTALTDASGAYEIQACPEDLVLEISLVTPLNTGQSCPTTYTVTVQNGVPGEQDIPVHLETDCPLLSVDIATPKLKPCFPGTYYVNYCNLSDQFVPNAHIEVALDPYVNFTTASIPGTALGNNSWDFPVGDLSAGQCAQFTIAFELDCAAPVGLTHCSEAHIFPDTVCDNAGNWTGAWLRVEGFCDGDSVRFSVTNIGSGDMANPLEFVVVEDLVMYMSAPLQLTQDASINLALPANGATWRLQVPQEPGFPWGGKASAFVEACGGFNPPSVANVFPNGSSNPFVSTFCLENVSSLDPNDKIAFPQGYDDPHFVEANTNLEYLIRFQNTGTDTAARVVLLDTLSGFLEIASVRPGASSHTYDFDILDGNILRFTFDNIDLPQAAVNEQGSHGFVKFRVRQTPDNPEGSVIPNRAAIYFDFNAPVITNETWHTVGSHFVVLSAGAPDARFGQVKYYPNPSAGRVWFDLPVATDRAQFELLDELGRTIRTETFAGDRYEFERGSLPAGLYFFKISTADAGNYSGKMSIR